MNAESYQLYLKGRFYWNRGTLEGLQKGIEYFEQAIEKDPSNAQAYAGLVSCYNDLGGGFAYLPPKDNFLKAKAAATKALEIDDSLAEAHSELGWTKWQYDWDWSGAEKESKLAIELKPSSAITHFRYAEYLMVMGRLTTVWLRSTGHKTLTRFLLALLERSPSTIWLLTDTTILLLNPRKRSILIHIWRGFVPSYIAAHK